MAERGSCADDTAEAVITGLHYRTASPVRIIVRSGRIARVEHSALLQQTDGKIASAASATRWAGVAQTGDPLWLAPGLVDLQVNGFRGADLNAATVSPLVVQQLVKHLWSVGVTQFLPTIITAAPSQIAAAARAVAAACEEDSLVAATVAGIHLEGPFISTEPGPRGAHDPRYVSGPDWEAFSRWQEAAGGRIRLVTLAPEWPQSDTFVRECVDAGVRVAIGHTAASTDQIQCAVAAGATLSTHLGNGAHAVLPRHPNYIWDQLANEQLWASFVGDGFHLPPAVMKVICAVKGERAFVVSDTVALGGLPAGHYAAPVGGDVVLDESGRLSMRDQPELLAGSAVPLVDAVARIAAAGVCSFADAWDMASTRPSAFLGGRAVRGLEPGLPADIAAFRLGATGVRIQRVWAGGRTVFFDGS
ncbi:MAG: amidohydrolase family protein [Firmicutes bacterium]|nr:amidohydrolase family protein [Bacillota bacterium]